MQPPAIRTPRIEIQPDGVRNLDYDDVYTASDAAWLQATAVYVQACELAERCVQLPALRVLELGFGLGGNFCATVATWQTHAPAQATLDYLAIEAHPLERATALTLPHRPGFDPELVAALWQQWPETPVAGLHELRFLNGRVRLLLWVGDVLQGLRMGFAGAAAHAAYLDGFAPERNPAMWSPQVWRALRGCLQAEARMASYCVAGVVRRSLEAAGFALQRVRGPGHKRAVLQGSILRQRVMPEPPRVDRVAVIGAGIAGLSVAAACAQAGIEVLLIDPQPGSGASANPAGCLHAPAGRDPDALRLQAARRHAMRWLDALADPEILLHVWEDELALQPTRLLQALRAQAGRRLIEVHDHVQRLERLDGGWCLHGADSRPIQVPAVVLANAGGATALQPALRAVLQPVRGQIDVLQAPAGVPGAPIRRGLGHYAIRLGADRWLVGASFQPGRTDTRVDPLDTARHREVLAALLEIPADLLTPLYGRASLRWVSPDRRPLVGAVGDPEAGHARDGWPRPAPGLWCSLAHGAHGLSTALVAADQLAAELSGRVPACAHSERLQLDPRRFHRR